MLDPNGDQLSFCRKVKLEQVCFQEEKNIAEVLLLSGAERKRNYHQQTAELQLSQLFREKRYELDQLHWDVNMIPVYSSLSPQRSLPFSYTRTHSQYPSEFGEPLVESQKGSQYSAPRECEPLSEPIRTVGVPAMPLATHLGFTNVPFSRAPIEVGLSQPNTCSQCIDGCMFVREAARTEQKDYRTPKLTPVQITTMATPHRPNEQFPPPSLKLSAPIQTPLHHRMRNYRVYPKSSLYHDSFC